MCIVYEVEGALYVNVTNRCSNRCDFCIRNNGDGAYGSESLWLLREPSAEEIVEAISGKGPDNYRETVFCGYGEPSYRLNEIREAALEIKRRYPNTKIRINTNGHSSLIHGFDTAPLYGVAFDTVSISLNTPTAEKYCEICHPVYGNEAFYALIDFAKNVKKYVQTVLLSVVRETLTEEELLECQKIADGAGVALKVRTYIGKED
ncbi:MAG: TatD family nuclease-associated radical SAM protein [Clostridia bacterium]|nr:TatD family nuclease-associated radical SAM protein [Clostridia bacterium]